jgi:hypothetical protein
MKRSIKLSNILIAALLICCVDPINFERPDLKPQLVVDGYISNLAGPYTVSLSRSRAVVGNQALRTPVPDAVVKIHSDAQEVETLVEKKDGIYVSTQVQGVVGRSYWITVELLDGSTFESTPEIIKPPATIDLVEYEYEHKTKVVNGLQANDDRFNLLVDATTASESENYFRWKVTGTYKIETRPDLITRDNPDKFGPPLPDPPKCSGWVAYFNKLDPNNSGKKYRVADCTCCTCWVTNYEEAPRLASDELLQGDQFRHVKVGVVPISPETFFEKYHVAITQMALTKSTFNYFKLLKAQKDGVTSLFQPISGKLRGNVARTDAEEEVLGMFYTAGMTTRTLFIEQSDLPVFPGFLEPILKDCRQLRNSTTTKPDFWQ